MPRPFLPGVAATALRMSLLKANTFSIPTLRGLSSRTLRLVATTATRAFRPRALESRQKADSAEGKRTNHARLGDDEGNGGTNCKGTLTVADRSILTEEVFSDYREVHGIHVPYEAQLLQNGQPILKRTLTNVVINSPVSDALFVRP